MSCCPKCQTEVQLDATYCENCGWKLDQPCPQATDSATDPTPAAPAGSLKERLAILANPIRQLKAKWPKRPTNATSPGCPGCGVSNDSNEPASPKSKCHRVLSVIGGILVGAAVIGFWVWLLLRKTGEKLVRSLWN